VEPRPASCSEPPAPATGGRAGKDARRREDVLVVKRLPQVIDREQWERLARQPSKRAPTGVRNLAVLHAMYFAGLRVSEVCALAPRDLKKQDMTLRVRLGKGKRDRSNLGVPVETWAVFERWAAIRPSSRYFFSTLHGNRLSERYVHQMVGRYATKAGVFKLTRDNEQVPIHPHVLRHSYATRLIEAGVPIHDVARALGHSSIATTQVYLHVNDAKLAEKLRVALSDGQGESELERIVARMLDEKLKALRRG
jgi:site-specific recombinase XerD